MYYLEGNERQGKSTSLVLHNMQAGIECIGGEQSAAAPHCLDAPCLANEQNSSLAFLAQYTVTGDGSLSDMLQLPFEYPNSLENVVPHYNALLVEDEHLLNIATPQQNPLILNTTHINHHIDEGVYMDYASILHEQHQLPSIINFSTDTQSLAPPLPHLPPLAPVRPPHTRRPTLRKGTASYREAHIQSERQRRQDMAQAFSRLRSLLPHMQDNMQEDRCTILGHVIKYVQDLERKVEELGRVKAQLMQEENKGKNMKGEEVAKSVARWTSNVSVRVWGNFDIFITLNCPKQPGLWPSLLALLQDTLQLDVQNVALSSTPIFCVHSIYAKVAGEKTEEVSCEELQERLGSFVATHTYI